MIFIAKIKKNLLVISFCIVFIFSPLTHGLNKTQKAGIAASLIAITASSLIAGAVISQKDKKSAPTDEPEEIQTLIHPLTETEKKSSTRRTRSKPQKPDSLLSTIYQQKTTTDQTSEVENPTLFFIGGTPGAGKSSLISADSFELPDDTIHIDPDQIKTTLPGWDISQPDLVHNLSRIRTSEYLRDAISQQQDVAVQGTGKRTEHLKMAKAEQYKTVGHFVWVPDNEADRRIITRRNNGGSNIPSHFGSKIAGELRDTVYPDQIKEGLYDEFHLWDNSGSKPRKIATYKKGGNYQINDRPKFNRFFGDTAQSVEHYWRHH